MLRPLHLWIFSKVLTRIPQDCTFAQGTFKDKLLSKPIDKLYSIDLTAATDRFPIELISKVLEGRFPRWWVSAWQRIMVGTPFDYNGSLIHYSVGNPMGALSSWATFTMAHHYVVYYCCKQLKISWKDLNYVLLGDDIVIAHTEVAEMYLSVMEDLGVDVSMAKTHVSKDTCEFAKRWLHEGSEITPFPISSLKESSKRYYSLINLLLEVDIKGWNLKCGIPEAIDSFYTFVIKRPSRFRKALYPKIIASEFIMKVMKGLQPVSEINNLAKLLGHRLPELTLEESQGILSNIVVEIFAESNPENFSEADQAKGKKPLGLLAEQLVCQLTDPGFESESKLLLGDHHFNI